MLDLQMLLKLEYNRYLNKTKQKEKASFVPAVM